MWKSIVVFLVAASAAFAFSTTQLILAATTWIILVAGSPHAIADIVFSDFTSTAGLNLVGSAATTAGRLRLTPNSQNQSGGTWSTTKQDVRDSFQTNFDFQLAPAGGSDGFAFLIQNSSVNALFGPGARLGYGGFGNETGGIPNSLAVQFDTFQNAENSDPNSNYISVQSRGTLSNSTNHLFTLGEATVGTLRDGNVHHAQINYVPGSLSLYFDGALTPLFVTTVNLNTLLSLDNGTAFVGFTAGTGGGSQNQDILSWQFTAVPEPATLTLLGSAVLLIGGRRFLRWRWRPRQA